MKAVLPYPLMPTNLRNTNDSTYDFQLIKQIPTTN